MSDAARRLFRELVERLRKLFDDLDISLEYHYRDTHRKTVDGVDKLSDVDRLDDDDDDIMHEGNIRAAVEHWRDNRLATRVAAIVDLSPTFKKDIERLHNEGWKIEYGLLMEPGFDKRLTIPISPRDADPQTAVYMAAHSLVEQVARVSGRSIGKTIAPPDPMDTWETWGANQVRKLLDRHSYAYLRAAQVRREILDRHGPDINADMEDEDWLWAQRADERVVDQTMTSNAAVRQLGDIVADQPFVDETTYAEYYRDVALEHWDGFHAGQWPTDWANRYY